MDDHADRRPDAMAVLDMIRREKTPIGMEPTRHCGVPQYRVRGETAGHTFDALERALYDWIHRLEVREYRLTAALADLATDLAAAMRAAGDTRDPEDVVKWHVHQLQDTGLTPPGGHDDIDK